MRAKLSKGNLKLGLVPNVSLTPIKTCAKGVPCAKLCYAMKSQRMYAATRDMRAHNTMAYLETPDEYFSSIASQVKKYDFFRWHVAGDCIDIGYCKGIISVAKSTPRTKHLLFTKRYDLWNQIDPSEIPENLAVLYSAWPGYPMENHIAAL